MTHPPAPSAPPPATLLYVEDEENDVFFFRRALARAGLPVDLQCVCDGDKAVAYLSGEPPYAACPRPRLILLDLNLPARSGFEVLAWLARRSDLRSIPVVVFSSSGRPDDRERAHALGARDYLLKPTSTLVLGDIARALWSRWLASVAPNAGESATPDPVAAHVSPTPAPPK
jgi:CheY-like chemotaxis protein